MTTINSNTSSIPTVPSTTSTPIASVPTTVTITAAPAPTISTKNSSNVAISPPATVKLAATTTSTVKPMTVADVLGANGIVPEGTVIKDTAANFNAAIKTLVGAKNVSSIVFTDAKPPTITVEKNFFKGDMTDATDEDLALVKKISSNYTLNITNVSAPMALVLKAPTKNATLSLSINDALVNLLPDFAAFQSLAKAKTISIINVDASPSGSPKPTLTITAAQLKSSPELLATIKGDYDLTIIGVAAADAVTVAGNADKVLKASGSQSTQAKVAITDTSANLVKNIAALELAATAGRLSSITVSDGKALVLTETQIKADSHFLATTFTSNATVEATAVVAADVTTVQSLVNANSKLTLTKESIADTAANIQTNMDNLEAQVKAGGTTPSSPTPTGTISPSPPAPLGPNQVYNPANGHVYEYVAHSGISWETAKAEADAKTYAGVGGYLTTITSQEEFDFIENHVIPNGPNSDNTYIGGHLASGSNTKWQWSDGPENGTAFWDNGAITGQYANFSQYGYPKANSNGSEPALAMNGYFLPGFNTVLGIPIGPQGSGNTGYVIEYSGFPPALTPKANAIISSITATDKGSITVTNSKLVNDIDALKVLNGKYTLNVTDISVGDALGLKAPSKDATLSLAVTDTAANIAANLDKLQSLVKAKTLSSITVSDSASPITITAAQLKSDPNVLKLLTNTGGIAVTGVLAADAAKTAATAGVKTIAIADSAANIIKSVASLTTLSASNKITSIFINDKTAPTVKIADVLAVNDIGVSNTSGVQGVDYNIADTASNIIAHTRFDIGDIIKNAKLVSITDTKTPVLTLADAQTLTSITKLDPKTKYSVADGGAAIAAQATISGEKVLSGAQSVTINKNYTVAQAKSVLALKNLDKNNAYAITDTVANILAESKVSGSKVLAGATAVNIKDTMANIFTNADDLETLAKSNQISDINFTDEINGNIDVSQLWNDAEIFGKITGTTVSSKDINVFKTTTNGISNFGVTTNTNWYAASLHQPFLTPPKGFSEAWIGNDNGFYNLQNDKSHFQLELQNNNTSFNKSDIQNLLNKFMTAKNSEEFQASIKFASDNNVQIQFEVVLDNPVDAYGNGNLSKNVQIPVNYNSISSDQKQINFTLNSRNWINASMMQPFISIPKVTTNGWGPLSSDNKYTITGNEIGHLAVNISSINGTNLTYDVTKYLAGLTSAKSPQEFDASYKNAQSNAAINNPPFSLSIFFGINEQGSNSGFNLAYGGLSPDGKNILLKSTLTP